MIDIFKFGSIVASPVEVLVADRILYEFDGPRIFSVETLQGSLLAYVISDEADFQIVLLCPTTIEILDGLVEGRGTVREALDHGWKWLAQVDWDGTVKLTVAVLAELPSPFLPQPGVMLYHSLQPILSVKLEGRELTATNVRASVIKQAVEAGTLAMKRIVDYIWDANPEGRPKNILRVLSDLPAQRLAFGSFQVDFAKPEINQLTLDSFALDQNLKTIGSELRELITWVTEGGTSQANLDIQLLKALEKLVPPLNGQVEQIEISGSLLGSSPPQILTRASTLKLKQALRAYEREEVLVSYTGRIRELDIDDLTFTLRELEEATDRNEVVCRFESELLDAILEHLADSRAVTITGRHTRKAFELSDLSISSPEEIAPVVSKTTN